MPEPFAYDVVDYPSAAMPQTHPGHLYAVARMYGADPAPPDRCRYLEVGCGDGMHLIGCALTMSDAAFVGVDLSEAAIRRGAAAVAELGLTNVTLQVADVTAWEPPAGGFDYAIAHGVYSWVPAPVRDAVLRVIARVLPPHGVGYVSYNALPGCHTRRMLWEILKRHTDPIPDPAEKISQAVELAKFLFAGLPPEGTGGPELEHYRDELQGLLNRHPSVIYHDDLSDINDPVYVREFTDHAARHGLRFVCETEPQTMDPRAFPAAVVDPLNQIAARDVVEKEQYFDYLRLRRFRQTVLSPDGRAPRASPDPTRIAGLALAGVAAPPDGPVDLSPGVAVAFQGSGTASVRTDLPAGKAALAFLAERRPARVPLPDVVAEAGRRIGHPLAAGEVENLAGLLTKMWSAGLVELNGHQPRYADTPSDRPVASPLARLQVRTGILATTLLHETMRLEDAPSRLLVRLLDGTRDRGRLAVDLLAAFPQDNPPTPDQMREALERNLTRLARAGMLVG